MNTEAPEVVEAVDLTFALELIEIFTKLFASKKRKGYNETGTNILIPYADTTNFP